MALRNVTVFKSHPFELGQKINISDGPRKGDWEVVALTDCKVKVRCPFSHREFDWDRFCYVVEEQIDVEWLGKE